MSASREISTLVGAFERVVVGHASDSGADNGWPAGLNTLLRLAVVIAVTGAVARWRARRSR